MDRLLNLSLTLREHDLEMDTSLHPGIGTSDASKCELIPGVQERKK
jgi:hypothetical protein